MDWVYMLECGDGSLYTGWTNDLAKRLAAHQSGRGAKYTRGRAPVRLVYAEQCTDKSAALRREAAVKALPRARKLELARQWETEEKAMAVAMDSQEARRRMEEGRLYLPGDEAIMAEQMDCLEKQYDYNATRPHEQERRAALLRELLGAAGENLEMAPDIRFDYGCNTYIGRDCYFNFNCTILDCAEVRFGDDVFVGPGCMFLTPVHPLLARERSMRTAPDGRRYNLEGAKPITVGGGAWLGGNVTVCPGVSIGAGAVIGAGSVVTRDIPPGVLAAGVPCRVIRPLTEADALGC